MKITFAGAAGTVTGSRYLVEHDEHRLLVDCGLFQGYKNLRLRNWAPFPVPVASIHSAVLTHAHLDHSGYVPALVRDGYAGPIYASSATRDLCGILLPDSGHLQEEDARMEIANTQPMTPSTNSAKSSARPPSAAGSRLCRRLPSVVPRH